MPLYIKPNLPISVLHGIAPGAGGRAHDLHRMERAKVD